MQIKRHVSVASFFTGHASRSFLGKPDHSITIFLSDDDILPKTFEGQVRRIAFELLPKRDEPNFLDQFVEYFELLKKGELDPYYQQILELTQDLSSKKERIDDLAKKVSLLVSDRSDHLKNVDALKDEINELYTKMDNWSVQMAELNEYNASLTLKIKDLNQTNAQQKNELDKKIAEIIELNNLLKENREIEDGAEKLLQQIKKIKLENEGLTKEIETLNETNKNLKFQVLKEKRENDSHLEMITNLRLEIRKMSQQTTEENNFKKKRKDDLIEMKKELKVLRRERDHYKEIVKKNKLL
jgi:chromosome segregation ATPase